MRKNDIENLNWKVYNWAVVGPHLQNSVRGCFLNVLIAFSTHILTCVVQWSKLSLWTQTASVQILASLLTGCMNLDNRECWFPHL